VKRKQENTGSGNHGQTIRPGNRRGVSVLKSFLFLSVTFIFILNHWLCLTNFLFPIMYCNSIKKY